MYICAMKILNCFTQEVIFEGKAETLKELVGLAIKSGVDLSRAKSIHDVLTIGLIGSRSAYLTVYLTDDGIVCNTGCFSGTLEEFKKAVKETHGKNKYGQAYELAIKLIEFRFSNK